MISLSVTLQGYDELRRLALFDDGRRTQLLGGILDHGRQPLMRMASGRIHNRTGRTVASAQSSFSGLHADVTFRGGGVFQERGTAPHVELARSQVMVFRGPEGMVFTSSVHHPGTRALHWAEAALDDSIPTLMGLAGDALGQMLQA